MKAALRLGIALVTAALALGPAGALAQEAPPATTNTPAADSVGPRDLQNFSLKGTVTQPSEQPAGVPAAPPARRTARTPPQSSAAAAPPSAETVASAAPAARRVENAPPQRQAAEQPRQVPASSEAAAPPPELAADSSTAHPAITPAAAVPAPAFAPEPATVDVAPEHKLPLVPWLLAALALGLGGGFLFWRNRSRAALAGGPHVDAFSAPEPAPAPRPAPVPRPAPAPSKAPAPDGLGIVSTRLRPWIDLAISPVRCVLESDKLTIEFELELFNSGSAPARAVLVEASLFSAGPTQDSDIGAFFADPVGAGDRIAAIAPLKRFSVKTHVAIDLEQLQAYEVAGGRRVIIPLIAFNALYRWSGGEGQTSVSYLLGRDTKSEKMAPFRLDLGPRVFRGVAARPLPTGVRN